MKKACVIFLLISYTTATLGAAINFHYCGGHLAPVSILNFGDKTDCSCKPEAMPKDCCKDKLLYSKVDNHKTQQVSYTINIISFTPYLPPVANLCYFNLRASNSDPDSFYKYARRSFPEPIYLRIRVFRI